MRRRTLITCAAALVGVAISPAAVAHARATRIVVSFPPGGPVDAPAITDVMGGQVAGFFGDIPGAEPAPSTPAELAALLDRDSKKWGKLIRDKKIKAE